ncbi:MAG: hypothetical protein H0W23_08795 [Chloroflexia bacterium]|nr:hypothetical protein [Chloroflexia bacterium]
MNALVLILPVLIVLTWARWVRPGQSRLEGSRVATVPIPILARARMHLAAGALTAAVAVTLASVDAASWWILAVPAVSYILQVLVPIHYTLTDIGLRLGWTGFHRWTEFAAVRRAPGGARLIGVQRGRGMHVWLSGSRGDDEFIHFLKQMIRDAYKGDRTTVPLPVPPGPRRGRWFVDDGDQAVSRMSAFAGDGSVTERTPAGIDPARR